MSNDLTERTIDESAPSANHFVAPLEETPLRAIDVVNVADKPSNLWIDAWRDARRRMRRAPERPYLHQHKERNRKSRATPRLRLHSRLRGGW